MAQTGYTPILIYSSSTTSNAPAAGNLTNSTLGSELAINITDGKLFYKDNANAIQVIAWKTTPTTAGGTGLTSYTAGDLLYYATGTTFTKLAIGASKTILTSSGTAPQWSTSLDTTQGGTGLTAYTAGDLPYFATGTALSKLAIGANTYVLTSSGTAPQWTAPSSVAIGTATNLAGGAAGSVPYQSGAGATTFVSIGSAYQALQVNAGGTAPSWQASATSTLTTQGDLLYASAANTLARLAKNTTATRYLANTGTSNNPAWAQVDLTNGVTGTLPVGNGGTGLASYTANRILYASGTTTIATSAGLTFDGTNFATTGTASATKFIPTGGAATGNGMYLPATNTLGFSTNGAEVGRFTSGGNFLVGTTTSQGNLTISGNSGTTNGVAYTKSADGTSIGNSGTITISQFFGGGPVYFGTLYLSVIGGGGSNTYDNIARMYAVRFYTNTGANDQSTLTALTSASAASGGQGGTMTDIVASCTGTNGRDLTITVTTSTTENRRFHAVFVGLVI